MFHSWIANRRRRCRPWSSVSVVSTEPKWFSSSFWFDACQCVLCLRTQIKFIKLFSVRSNVGWNDYGVMRWWMCLSNGFMKFRHRWLKYSVQHVMNCCKRLDGPLDLWECKLYHIFGLVRLQMKQRTDKVIVKRATWYIPMESNGWRLDSHVYSVCLPWRFDTLQQNREINSAGFQVVEDALWRAWSDRELFHIFFEFIWGTGREKLRNNFHICCK